MDEALTHASRRSRATAVALVLLLCVPAAARAQDALARARDLYASAAYEEALQLLDSLKDPPPSVEASAYQVFCLMALGRRDEARTAIEAIVRRDPSFKPAAAVSPRIRAFFDEVRTPMLPDTARAAYASGKAAFDREDWTAALAEFDRALAILEEIGESEPGLGDLKLLAAGFRDLAHVASLPPPPPPDPPASPPPPPEPAVYGDGTSGVVRPVLLTRDLPEWRPNTVEAKMTFSGVAEIVVGEDGHVLSASIIRSIHPRYDDALLEAVKAWTFRPAMKDGVAVRYRYTLDIRLGK
jgi:TonB family protein